MPCMWRRLDVTYAASSACPVTSAYGWRNDPSGAKHCTTAASRASSSSVLQAVNHASTTDSSRSRCSAPAAMCPMIPV